MAHKVCTFFSSVKVWLKENKKHPKYTWTSVIYVKMLSNENRNEEERMFQNVAADILYCSSKIGKVAGRGFETGYFASRYSKLGDRSWWFFDENLGTGEGWNLCPLASKLGEPAFRRGKCKPVTKIIDDFACNYLHKCAKFVNQNLCSKYFTVFRTVQYNLPS